MSDSGQKTREKSRYEDEIKTDESGDADTATSRSRTGSIGEGDDEQDQSAFVDALDRLEESR